MRFEFPAACPKADVRDRELRSRLEPRTVALGMTTTVVALPRWPAAALLLTLTAAASLFGLWTAGEAAGASGHEYERRVIPAMPGMLEQKRNAKAASGMVPTRDRAHTRVIGGTPAGPGTWPAQAALLQEAVEPTLGWFCGGTLIAPRWVLTAAHCVQDTDPRSLEVAIGINDLEDIQPTDRIDVSVIEVHPSWDPVTSEWDFALLYLASPSAQPPMDLIGPGDGALTEGGDPAKIAGWGCVSDNWRDCGSTPGSYPFDLQEATISFVSDALCEGLDSYGSRFYAASMICAGDFADGRPDACSGDSGGPLVAFATTTPSLADPKLAGVTSWGDGCALAKFPGIYGRVAAARGWIDAQLASTPTPPAPPANDDFENATTMTGTDTAAAFTTRSATRQTGEFVTDFSGTTTVWYRWAAPVAGTLTADTCESTGDSILAAYTGSALTSLTLVGNNDDDCEVGLGSRIRMDVAAGVTYSFQVNRYVNSRQVAAGQLKLAFEAAPVPTPAPAPAPAPRAAALSKPSVKGPAKVKRGQRVTFQITVTNSGEVDASGVKVSVSGKGVRVARRTVGAVTGAATKTVKVTIRPRRPGNVVVTFRATSTNAGSTLVKRTIRVVR